MLYTNYILVSATSHGPFEWINTYIRAVSESQARKYSEAIISLTSIECLKNNPKILATIGEIYYFCGDYERAFTYLKRSYDLYPYMKEGIQKYAMLCDMFKKTRTLQELIRPVSAFPYDYSSENFFVMAQYLYTSLKYEKAQYFITRVILQHQNRNVDALILSAKILHCSKKSNEALILLRQALKHEPYRFEVHRWIIEIMLNTDRARDAQNQATKSLKILGESPRSLTLAASTYLKSPVSKEKAKMLLLKALELNEHYAKAVFFLAQILIDDKETKAAVKLLEKTSAIVPNVKITLMLADLYAKLKNFSAALEQYTKVINIEGSNRHALSGLMALGSTSTAVMEKTTLDACADEDISDPSGGEPPVELNTSRIKSNDESDSELVWSDMDTN